MELPDQTREHRDARVVTLHSTQEAPATDGEHQESTRYALLNDLLHGGMGRRLRFPDALEGEFRYHQALESAALFRTSGFYVLTLFLALGFGLMIILPGEVLGYWPAGYSALALVILSGLILSRQHRLDPRFEGVAGTLALLGMALVATLPALSADPLMYQGSMIGSIHAAVVIGGMLGLRCVTVIVAVIGGGVLGLSVLALHGVLPEWLLLHQTFTAGALVAIVLAWLAERRNRLVFLQKKLLELEKARSESLAERMKEMSRHDGLTGLANRRHFDEALHQEWQRCRRDGASLSLVFIDVDYFKPYNDHYGHQAGDDVLRQVGEVLAEYGRRPGDLAARYGGEEFVLLYPQTGPEAAAQLAEQIRASVEALGLAHGRSECAAHVTVSIGAASVIPEPSRSADELVEAADHAVYQAKLRGRNRVETSPVPRK